MAKRSSANLDTASAAEIGEAVVTTSAPAAVVYTETVQSVAERGGKPITVTFGKRHVLRHVEEPAGSGRWLDYQEAVWEEIPG